MSNKCLNDKEWDKFYFADGIMDEVDFSNHMNRYTPYFKMVNKYVGKKRGLILEIACGPAKLVTCLTNKYDHKIITTDNDGAMLKIAKLNIKNFGNPKKVRFYNLDCFKLLNDQRFKKKKFDLITHHGFIEHFKNINEVVKLINIQLKISKYVVFGLPYYTNWNINNVWNKKNHRIYRSKWLYKEWKKFLTDSFNVVEIHPHRANTDELYCAVTT